MNTVYFSRVGPVGYPTATYDLYDIEFHNFAGELVTPLISYFENERKETYNLIAREVFRMLVFYYLKRVSSSKENMINALKGTPSIIHFDAQHAAIISSTLLRVLCTEQSISKDDFERMITEDNQFHISWGNTVTKHISFHEMAIVESQANTVAQNMIRNVFQNIGWNVEKKDLSDLYYTIAK